MPSVSLYGGPALVSYSVGTLACREGATSWRLIPGGFGLTEVRRAGGCGGREGGARQPGAGRKASLQRWGELGWEAGEAEGSPWGDPGGKPGTQARVWAQLSLTHPRGQDRVRQEAHDQSLSRGPPAAGCVKGTRGTRVESGR